MRDFLANHTNDLVIVGGDLAVIEDATRQHQQDILIADKGHFHHTPPLGVGLTNYLHDTTTAAGLLAAIRGEMERDGQRVNRVRVQNGELLIDANYGNV